MTGTRLSLALPGRTSADLLEAARAAERWGLWGLWIGDPERSAPNSDDSYVTAAAAAVAAATRDLRIGMFLGLRGSAAVVRVAEDVAVVDQISEGRAELALVPPISDGGGWARDARALIDAPHGWALPSGELLPVTPGPAQPVVPVAVLDDAALARRIGADEMTTVPRAPLRPDAVRRRILLHRVKDRLLAADPTGQVHDLRLRLRRGGAHDLVLLLPGADVPPDQEIRAVATVLGTSLRAAERDVAQLVRNASVWLEEAT